ncbi:MAG: dTMP kinase, partial [Duodenibacillus sp.]|nr:dTMP kinase [Duodenibacillus sp.]
DATYAYQVGAKGVAGADVEALERIAIGGLRPGRTFLFDLDPAEAARRRARARAADRFEAEDIAFFERVRGAYLARAHADPGRFLIVDAAGPEAGITRRILEEAAAWP